jgi:putative heme iron utilization protein
MSNLACKTILESTTGSLGTVDDSGRPFVSLVTVAAASPTEILLLLSGLAKHTRHLVQQPECALMFVQRGGESGDPLAGARLTVRGTVRRIDDDAEAREVFLDKHPSAARYAEFDDFNYYKFEIVEAYLVAGFGRIETIPAAELKVPRANEE